MAKVSVIVPVYNAEETLISCLGNLVHQTLDDIEIILINDCSTDNSFRIMQDCEEQFSDKIILINLEENLGPGGARNVGLMYASGEYIGFVDSDDLVDTTMFSKMYERATEGDYDIVSCGFLDEKNDIAILLTTDERCGDVTPKTRNEMVSECGYLWYSIYKKKLWDGVTFREHATLEDLDTSMLMYLNADRVGTVKETLYRYKNQDGSLSKLKEPFKYQKTMVGALEAIIERIMTHPRYDEIWEAVEYTAARLTASTVAVAMHNVDILTPVVKDKHVREITKLMLKIVKHPMEENRFIKAKMTKLDMDCLDACIKAFG